MNSLDVVQRFIGTWRLVSQYTFAPDGSAVPSRGEHPAGLLMYDAAGNMAVQLMRTDPSAREFSDRTRLNTAMMGYLAYYGTYEIDETRKLVSHHIIGASYPDWQGTIQIRQYELNDAGDTLILKALAPDGASLRVLTWQRIG